MSNSHTKLGWILSNGLGGDSITDVRAEAFAISPSLFQKSVGIKNDKSKEDGKNQELICTIKYHT